MVSQPIIPISIVPHFYIFFKPTFFMLDKYLQILFSKLCTYLNQSLPSMSLIVQSSPLKLKNFSLSFSTVRSLIMYLKLILLNGTQNTMNLKVFFFAVCGMRIFELQMRLSYHHHHHHHHHSHHHHRQQPLTAGQDLDSMRMSSHRHLVKAGACATHDPPSEICKNENSSNICKTKKIGNP